VGLTACCLTTHATDPRATFVRLLQQAHMPPCLTAEHAAVQAPHSLAHLCPPPFDLLTHTPSPTQL
jgi:hypothetical protein